MRRDDVLLVAEDVLSTYPPCQYDEELSDRSGPDGEPFWFCPACQEDAAAAEDIVHLDNCIALAARRLLRAIAKEAPDAR